RRSTPLILFFQAEDGIRDRNVTGVQTCALPISSIIASHLSLRKVATVGMEDIHFYHPFGLHDALTMTAYLTGLGNRSAEVFVKRSEERRVGKECRVGPGRGD